MNNSNKILVSSNALTRQSGTIKVLNQTGQFIDVARDKGRKALMPGKRISRSGKEYWETRKNRSDKANTSL